MSAPATSSGDAAVAGAIARLAREASLEIGIHDVKELEAGRAFLAPGQKVSITFLPTESKAQVLQNLAKVRVSAHYRVAGHDYRLLAGGNTHFTMYNKLMPWDHLAGTLIVQEAGGYAARFDGSPYLPGQTSGGLIVTTDPETWNLLRKEVFTV